MQLAIRLSSAQLLLDEYLKVINPYVAEDDDGRSKLLDDLNQLRSNCINVSTKMLNALGYSGTLESMEQELNSKIKELQSGTVNLNGNNLYNFILKGLSEAFPYSVNYQNQYSIWLQQFLNNKDIYEMSDQELENMAKQIFADLGLKGNYVIKLSQEGGAIVARGFDRRTGSTPLLNITKNFTEQRSKKMRDLLAEKFSNPKVNNTNNSVNIGIPVDSSTIYSLLKNSKTPDPLTKSTIEDLLKADPAIVTKVNEYMIREIVSNCPGADAILLEDCIRYVLSKQDGETLFFVGNNIKGMTGALGEIQGLYYIRSILKTNKVSNATVDWIGKNFNGQTNPHADLLLETLGQNFGIQVKNTSKQQAELEVSFESFKSDLVKHMEHGRVDFNWLKESANKFQGTIMQDKDLFNAATGLIGMEAFNVPYIWSSETETKAREVASEEVPVFAPTRQKIIEAADKARKALLRFIAGMMYMQMSPISDGNSSTLYLVGGTLAITSATILTDIIKNLDDEITRVNFYFNSKLKDKAAQKTSKMGTIVDFLNASPDQHKNSFNSTYYFLQSSYTFTL